MMKVWIGMLGLVLASVSESALAHLKWFAVDAPRVNLEAHYSTLTNELIVGGILFFLLIAVAVWLNRKIVFDVSVDGNLQVKIVRVFCFLVGFSLLFASYNESILAAHYSVSNRVLVFLQYAQAVIALMLILNVYITAAAYLLISLYLALATQVGVLEVLDYINVLGIAMFLVLFHSKDEQLRLYATPVIRVVTGITLVVLAFSEKLLNPDLGLRFLALNDWNFMYSFGLSAFTNEVFVLAAGLVELLIGIVFILGLLTRINTLVLLAFMITSNFAFMFQSSDAAAMTELAGHAPILAIAIILLSLGTGRKWRVA